MASRHIKKQNGFSPIGLAMIVSVITMAFLGLAPAVKTGKNTGNTSIPKFIQADFIDLSKITNISKFRSGSGHDFSRGSGETCRSMKHYFNVDRPLEIEQLINKNKGMSPLPDGKTDIPIYSPVNGKIIGIEPDQFGKQFYIQPDSHPKLTVRIFHVYPLPGIQKGGKVKAGQKIGVIGQYQNTDIAIAQNRTKYISYFEVMPDKIFAKYQALGVKNREELIISKAARDANPLKCNGEWFAEHYESDPNNFVYLRASPKPAREVPPVMPPAALPEAPKPQVKLAPQLKSPSVETRRSNNLFETQAGVSFDYFWPKDPNSPHLSAEETEILVFNETKNPVIISQISFAYFSENSEASIYSGTWERFPSAGSWERVDYVNIGKGDYSNPLTLNAGEKGKIHYHISLPSPPTADKKQSAKIKINFSVSGVNYAVDKVLNR